MLHLRRPPAAATLLVACTAGVRGVFSGGPGDGSGAASATAAAMDRMAAKAAKSGSAFNEEVQAERRAALHRKQEERRRLVERGEASKAAGKRQTFTGANSVASENANTSAADDEARPAASLFVKKLDALHSDSSDKRKQSVAAQKQERKAKIRLEERRKMLKFRDVDEELDSLILKRDLFLWLTTLRSGMTDSIIDQLLERELRFYAEESNKEVRYTPKLMVGLPHLSATGGTFPTLNGLTRMSSLPLMQDQAKSDKLDDSIDKSDAEAAAAAEAAKGEGSDGAAATKKADKPSARAPQRHPHRLRSSNVNAMATIVGGDPTTAQQRLKSVLTGSGKDEGAVTVNKATFPKPTLVTLSQFTYSTAVQQYDDLWVELLRPDTAPAPLDPDAPPSPSAAAVAAAQFTPSAFNVLRLKSIETRAADWMRKVLISSFCRGLDMEIAQETLFADKLTRAFMPTFGLRNYSTTYCFLVDTRGRVRWMSAGEPSKEEREVFPSLLRELELETLRSSGNLR